ncbi:alpha-mannosidase 2-like isoform X2 [Mya arenaria]|uniref:alpha-mannosidase 2-like isoform X2 n=1 Tax=Mya arenaria TaxID=6604 RepID=UPI0022E2AB2E|nr:alpha-mannosidase 2-like isoform X2 [Mya arenaria]
MLNKCTLQMRLRMKFRHRVAVFCGLCAVAFIYILMIFLGLLPNTFSSHQEKLRKFMEQNPLQFHFYRSQISSGECRADFSTPKGVISTLEISQKTNYKSSGGDYVLPHPPVDKVAYGAGLEPLKVIIMPHSHVDPGWIETVDGYYNKKVRSILDSMVRKLHIYNDLTFIWAEIVFFSRWWDEKTDLIRLQVKDLVKEGRLEFVLGGWVMPDEASTSYTSVIDQLTEGHQWLLDNLGVIPNNSWSVDPFGHSGTMPYIWKLAGMKNMVIGRIHQAVKGQLIHDGNLEFNWKQVWDGSNDGDIFCHVMPYMIYTLHQTCGPDKYICSQYDFKQKPGDPMNVFVKPITPENIAKRAQRLYEQYRLKGSIFKHKTILVALGDDFRFNLPEEWDQQYENYKKLMDYMNNQREWKINVKFGTLNDFFKNVRKSEKDKGIQFQSISGDFFPYSDHDSAYWTGYFSTRPFDKRFYRETESKLHSAEIMHAVARAYSKKWQSELVGGNRVPKLLSEARNNLGLFLHHDAVTGTSKDYVMEDYENRLLDAYNNAGMVINYAAQFLLTQGKLPSDPPVFEQELTRLDGKHFAMHNTINVTKSGSRIALFNPTGHIRSEFVEFIVDSIDLEIKDSKRKVRPFQINPVYTSPTEVDRKVFEIVFLVEIPAFSIETYIIQKTNKSPSGFWSKIKVYNSDEFIVGPELKFEQEIPRRRGNVHEPIFIENSQIGAEFKSFNGLLTKIVDKTNNRTKETQVLLDFKEYKSRGSGAYIFFPYGSANDIVQPTPVVRVVEGPFVTEVQVPFYCMYHRVKLYHHPGLQGRQLHIQNTLDMFAVNFRDKEPIMRLSTSILNEKGSFFTDQNGFQYVQRKSHPTDKNYQNIERNYYPATTMAFLQDSDTRITLHTGQPMGVASLERGWLEVMLDRQLLYDDGRGLGEGVSDNKLTMTSFILQVEHSDLALRETTFSYPSIQSLVTNEVLMHPLERIFSLINSDIVNLNFSPMQNSLPCDIHISSMKTLYHSNGNCEGTGLVLHRRGFRCGLPTDAVPCLEKDINLEGLFPGVEDNSIQETTLGFTKKKASHVSLRKLDVSPMEIKSFLISENN